MQIEEESLKMAQYTDFRFVCIVGGERPPLSMLIA